MTVPYPHFGLSKPYVIAVYSPEGRLPKILRDCLGDDVAMIPVSPDTWTGTDVYVSATALNWRSERSAGVLGAPIVVLPEGTRWLHDRVVAAPQPLRVFVATRQGDRPAPTFERRSA
jgi:hypothetical protein